jgi:hypothetical protein
LLLVQNEKTKKTHSQMLVDAGGRVAGGAQSAVPSTVEMLPYQQVLRFKIYIIILFELVLAN